MMSDTASPLDPALVWVAGTLALEPKELAKTRAKVQKLLGRSGPDSAAKPRDGPSGSCWNLVQRRSLVLDEKIFGGQLQNMLVTSTRIVHHHHEFSLTIPSFLLDICTRILQQSSINGLLNVPGNGTRITYAMDALNSGTSLDAICDLDVHDLCHLLKEWTRELSIPLIPEPLIATLFRSFDNPGGKPLLPLEKGAVVRFLSRSLLPRSRDVLAFLAHFLGELSARSADSGMTVENLARVCPSMFARDIPEAYRDTRAFAIPIKFMEFAIRNPHSFLEATVPPVPFLDAPKKLSTVIFYPALASPKPVEFKARFKSATPKRRALTFDIRNPVQSIRTLMGAAATNRKKDKSFTPDKSCSPKFRLVRSEGRVQSARRQNNLCDRRLLLNENESAIEFDL